MSSRLDRGGRTSGFDGGTAGVHAHGRGPAMTALFIALFFAVASNTMVLTGLPQIIGDLYGTPVQYTWIVTTSLLVLAVTTPVWGRLADRYSATRLLLISLAIYAVGSIGAGSAFEPWTIVACRVLIGAGAGGIVTLVQLIVTGMTSPRERPKFFGMLGSVTSVAAILAPALGGLIVDVGGWRWVFYSTAPVALIALVMVWRFAPVISTTGTPSARFDVSGTVLIASTVTAAMIALSALAEVPLLAATAGAATALLLLATVLVERRALSPLIPPALMRNRHVVLVLIASGVGGVAAFGTSVYLAMYFQDVRGATAGESGLLLIPLSIATLIASLSVGVIVSRTGRDKMMLALGMGAVVAGYGMLVPITPDSPLAYVVAGGAVVSLGVGAVTQQVIATGQRFLRDDELAVGSSLILFLRSLMTVLCLSGFGAVLAAMANGAGAPLPGIRIVLTACLVIGAAGFVAVLSLPAVRMREKRGNVAITPRDEPETVV
jgi:MFS family permease